MRGPGLAAFVILLLALVSDPAAAYFESVRPGGRALGLGGAYVALAEDPWGLAWNPAGLARISGFEAALQHETPYEIGELHRTFLGAAHGVPGGGLGLGWSQTRLEGALREDLFVLGLGINVATTTQGEFLAVGGALKLARVSSGEYGSDAVPTADLGVMIRPFSMISLGYATRNLGRPVLDVVGGGGGTALRPEHEYGLAFRWQGSWTVSLSRRRDAWGRWHGHLGTEYGLGSGVALRGGLFRSRVTGGVSWTSRRFTLDAAVAAHEVLGMSYRLTFSFFPAGGHGTGTP
jgi:hypothetical protein